MGAHIELTTGVAKRPLPLRPFSLKKERSNPLFMAAPIRMHGGQAKGRAPPPLPPKRPLSMLRRPNYAPVSSPEESRHRDENALRTNKEQAEAPTLPPLPPQRTLSVLKKRPNYAPISSPEESKHSNDEDEVDYIVDDEDEDIMTSLDKAMYERGDEMYTPYGFVQKHLAQV